MQVERYKVSMFDAFVYSTTKINRQDDQEVLGQADHATGVEAGGDCRGQQQGTGSMESHLEDRGPQPRTGCGERWICTQGSKNSIWVM